MNTTLRPTSVEIIRASALRERVARQQPSMADCVDTFNSGAKCAQAIADATPTSGLVTSHGWHNCFKRIPTQCYYCGGNGKCIHDSPAGSGKDRNGEAEYVCSGSGTCQKCDGSGWLIRTFIIHGIAVGAKCAADARSRKPQADCGLLAPPGYVAVKTPMGRMWAPVWVTTSPVSRPTKALSLCEEEPDPGCKAPLAHNTVAPSPSGYWGVVCNPGLPPLVYDIWGPVPFQSSAGLTIEQKQTILEYRAQAQAKREEQVAYVVKCEREAEEEAAKHIRAKTNADSELAPVES